MSGQSTDSASQYYDVKAQSFFEIWGGEHIHFGLYDDGKETLVEASTKTMEKMYSLLSRPQPGARILELGSGFGGPARYLARKGHQITCVDLSTANNRVNRRLNEERGLSSINVLEESIDALSAPDDSFDIVWSQAVICHVPDLEKAFGEVYRVLRPGGEFALDNTCCSESIPEDVRRTLNKRNSLSLQTIGHHSRLATASGFTESVRMDVSDQPGLHYKKMLQGVHSREAAMVERDGRQHFERVVQGLEYWLKMCDEGHMTWGIWKLVK